MMLYLTVDGMFSGTGIRDTYRGDYLNPEDLCISSEISQRIVKWLSNYSKAHYGGFEDNGEAEELDAEGIKICLSLKKELPDSKIEYYSDALSKKIRF